MLKVDVLFAGETRKRAMQISGPPGLTFLDEATGKILFTTDGKAFVRVCLEVLSTGRAAEWAKRAHASLQK